MSDALFVGPDGDRRDLLMLLRQTSVDDFFTFTSDGADGAVFTYGDTPIRGAG